ncbi:flagellar motor switch protein FliN [Nevskia ramosa]|uniref:flagellar motor switch protein FliN n=1 Tax=Nevskia ramosa TaxID=64002 RepID=UPI0003B50B67
MSTTPSNPFSTAPKQDDPMSTTPQSGTSKDYARASFQNLEGSAANAGGLGNEFNLDVILDVAVTLSMEVGRARIPIRNLLQLNQGSVVELERAAGEPLDVYANGTLIAHGEVVVVNEKFGVRLTDVVSPAERIRKLK